MKRKRKSNARFSPVGKEFQSLYPQMLAKDGMQDHEKDEEVHPGSHPSACLQMAVRGQ